MFVECEGADMAKVNSITEGRKDGFYSARDLI